MSRCATRANTPHGLTRRSRRDWLGVRGGPDRVLLKEAGEQRYGTQWVIDPLTRASSPSPIGEAERVDERRANVGLGTLAENKQRIDDVYGAC